MIKSIHIQLRPGETVPESLARILKSCGVPLDDLEHATVVELAVRYQAVRKCSSQGTEADRDSKPPPQPGQLLNKVA